VELRIKYPESSTALHAILYIEKRPIFLDFPIHINFTSVKQLSFSANVFLLALRAYALEQHAGAVHFEMEFSGKAIQLFLPEKFFGNVQHRSAVPAHKVSMGLHSAIKMLLPVNNPNTDRFPCLADFFQVPIHGAQAEIGVPGL
jgi:hypothetical protein